MSFAISVSSTRIAREVIPALALAHGAGAPGASFLWAHAVTITADAFDASSAAAAASAVSRRRTVVLVCDVSGSMGGRPLELVRATALMIRTALQPEDRLGIVKFHDTASVVLPPTAISGLDAAEFEACVARELVAQGCTNIEAGMRLGINMVDGDQDTVLLLLSDGQPNRGISDTHEMFTALSSEAANNAACRRMLVHSLGFTANHDANMLQALTSVGPAGIGLYAALHEDVDIPMGLGECLGTSKDLVVQNLLITGQLLLPAAPEPLPCHVYSARFCHTLGGLELNIGPEAHVAYLAGEQQYTVVVVCETEPVAGSTLRLATSFCAYGSDRVEQRTFEFALQVAEPMPPVLSVATLARLANDGPVAAEEESGSGGDAGAEAAPAQLTQWQAADLHVFTHVLRLEAARFLIKMTMPGRESMLGDMELVHAAVMALIALSRQLGDSQLVVADEGILQTLERDLGEALHALQHSAEENARQASLFLSFAHEHAVQRSSNASNRTSYSGRQQLAHRLRFLAGSSTAPGAAPVDKTTIAADEAGLAPESVAARLQRDDDVCFVTLCNWRETALGIGLLIQPRSVRERYRGLLPTIELVEDYLSAEAYNMGVRTALGRTGGEEEDRDADLEGQNVVVTSSARGRINGWLPLYVNADNWRCVRGLAPSAFSLIATQFNDIFRPEHALSVCVRLMTCTIVNFTINQERMSERAVQMYADIHRLLLQMCAEYPSIRQEAEAKLEAFRSNPSERRRSQTANLGDLFQFLTVTDTISWADMIECIMPEHVRRHARFVGHININELATPTDLMVTWEQRVVSGRVALFTKLFLDVVARPGNRPIAEVMADYDSRWCRLSDAQMASMRAGYERLMAMDHPLHKMQELTQQPDMAPEAMCEVLLWGLETRLEGKNVKPPMLSDLLASRRRYDAWQAGHNLWLQSLANPPPMVAAATPLSRGPLPGLSGVAAVVASLPEAAEVAEAPAAAAGPPATATATTETPTEAPGAAEGSAVAAVAHTHRQHCDCKRCQAAAVAAGRAEAWRRRDATLLEDARRTAFIKGLPKTLTEEQLGGLLACHGPVERVSLVRDAATGASRRYAFAVFGTEAAFAQFLAVSWATPSLAWQTGAAAQGDPILTEEQAGRVVVDVLRAALDSEQYLPRHCGGGIGLGRSGAWYDRPRLGFVQGWPARRVLGLMVFRDVLSASAHRDMAGSLAALPFDSLQVLERDVADGDTELASWEAAVLDMHRQLFGHQPGTGHCITIRQLPSADAMDWRPLHVPQTLHLIVGADAWLEIEQCPGNAVRGSLVVPPATAFWYGRDASDAATIAFRTRPWGSAAPFWCVSVSKLAEPAAAPV